jgi:hypothetical protein
MHGSVYKCHYALFLFAALLASFELMYRPVECIMHASIATSGSGSWVYGCFLWGFVWHSLWRFASHDRGADISSVYMAKTYLTQF